MFFEQHLLVICLLLLKTMAMLFDHMYSVHYYNILYQMHGVRMAERSKALRSGRSPHLWAWVRIPLLTTCFYYLKGLEAFLDLLSPTLSILHHQRACFLNVETRPMFVHFKTFF